MTDDEESLVELEYELTTLVRMLEALNRCRNYPLERAHYLLLLQLSEGPWSIGELATKLLLDNSTVTRQINVMVKSSLIEKIPNPNDGRSALVRSTKTGRELAEAMHQLRLDRLQAALKDWTVDNKLTLASLTRRLTRDLLCSLEVT